MYFMARLKVAMAIVAQSGRARLIKGGEIMTTPAGRVILSRVKVTATFDYNSVEPDVANYLRGEAGRIRRHYTASIVQIGKALIRAKHYLCHGEFIRWVECEAGIPARTAQAYMRVAQWASDKSATVAHLPPTVLYILSAPSTPKELAFNILKRADAGEQIPPLAVMRQELKALREAKRQGHGIMSAVQASPDQNAATIASATEGKGLLREAVALVARGLSTTEFHRFRDIMTSRRVLDDPKLARNILSAFLTIECPIRKKGEEVVTLRGNADMTVASNGASLRNAIS